MIRTACSARQLALFVSLMVITAGIFSSFWCAFADDALTPYEQSFSMPSSPGEPLEQRLGRLESVVFGEIQSGDSAARQQRLLQVLRATNPANAATVPSGSSAGQMSDDSENAEPSSFQSFTPARKPDATDYPTVTTMERKVFGRDFIREDITQRLNRLERKVFNTTYPSAALIDRVDKLTMRVPGMAISRTGSPLDQLPASSTELASSNMDTYLKLDALEKFNFNGKTNSGMLITERLDQLEKKTLGNTYSGESVDTRVNRLLSYSTNNAPHSGRQPVQSRPSYQSVPTYGSNGDTGNAFSSSSSTPYSASTRRQNIQIGSGFSSQSSQQYSPELMNMLPPNIRTQMQQGGGTTSTYQSSSSGFVASGPGTVVIQQQTEYPGFYNYSQAPLQYRNLYVPPGSFSSGVTSNNTMVGTPYTQDFGTGQLPAPGSALSSIGVPALPSGTTTSTYTYTQPLDEFGNPIQQASTYYGYPQQQQLGYGNPYGGYGVPYTGDPATLQQLNNLELNAYGHVNSQLPVPYRISQLEASLLGQNLGGMGYSDVDRLNNLQRTAQYQSLGKMLGNGKLGKIGRTAGSMLLGVPLNNAGTAATPLGTPIAK